MTPSQVRFHDFELDPDRFELRRAGRRIRLERKPMELLILLTEKQGRLVAREEIIERVWGKDFYFDAERGINNAIRKTRAALNDNPERPRFVETVVGKGYRFIAPIQLPAKNDAAESAEKSSSAKQAGTRQTAPAQSWLQHSRAAVALAALLTVLLLALTPVVWRGGRRLDSWSMSRKLRFTVTTVVFAAFAAQLLLWGALAPWSG